LHTLEDLRGILSLTYHTSIQGIELILKYDPRNTDEAYIEFIESVPIVSRLTVHCAPTAKELVATFGCSDESKASLVKKVAMIEQRITSEHHCGVINTGSLTPPTGTVFFENRFYNGCLNRKISIDAEGYIKNCPSMRVSFGHHRETSLMEIAMDNEFQSMWHIKKDTIRQCKDCEFRYACTDCRAYVETPNDKLSKPLKCGYDPYTGTWEEWDRNPAKEWAIKHYALDI
ncbi:MAG TPA: grasp-with-spasm system SPASM domain peptide maturase, partial [Nitrococcus sp.]|nr:grasp-with-spasm system SPASM domain peptide maturase [Nitrococcus sp.]